MSSIGRASAKIDLNTGTISAIDELRQRVDILDDKVVNEKILHGTTIAFVLTYLIYL